MIFYREQHKNRLYLFLSFIGFLSALIATFLYLMLEPEVNIFGNIEFIGYEVTVSAKNFGAWSAANT